MALDEPAHRRHHSSNAIPLEELNGHGQQEHGSLDVDKSLSHRRTLSDRGRALFRREKERQSNKRYAPLNERSPSPPQRQRLQPRGNPLSPVAYVTSPSGQHERIPDEDDEAAFSPVGDLGSFQSAITFAGLSYNAGPGLPVEDFDDAEGTPPTSRRRTRDGLPTIRTVPSRDFVPVQLDDGPAFFSPVGAADEDDTLPLTRSSPLRSSTLAAPTTPNGQKQDRHRRRSSGLPVRSSPGRGQSGSRLGDDLRTMEAGGHSPDSHQSRSPSSRQRSLSPSSGESPLHRTGTILRKMSQRVVNVSNESDLVERTMRRRTTLHRPSNASYEPPSVLQDEDTGMDGAPRSPASEKLPSPVAVQPETPNVPPVVDRNPLRGNSLGVFTPESKIRQGLLKLLVHPLFEPFILLLIIVQTILLVIDAAPSVSDRHRPWGWGRSWTDYTLFVIFVIYTVEVAIKIVVSGFVFNPREYSTIDRSVGVRQALLNKVNDLFALHRRLSQRGRGDEQAVAQAPSSLLRSFTVPSSDDVPGGSQQAQKQRLAHRAFLRHSFNRLDFVAIVSFWISCVLGTLGVESSHHIYVFRMMSCLRILRLLGITSGTSVILRSLKRAAPTLLNVAFLIGFFWLLFAIVGVQSFKSSLRRTCVWNWNNLTIGPGDPAFPQPEYAQTDVGNFQFCGGWIAAETHTAMPWLKADGQYGAETHKGYLCPTGSFCVEGDNPYNGTVSFDNIVQSLQMVFVIMTSNTFTDDMYYLTDSDYLAAALFQAFGIVILTFWLMNLLIAVITSSFQVIREESQSSAFMAAEDDLVLEEKHDDSLPKERVTGLKKAYRRSYWLWNAVIVFGLVVQCFRTATMSQWTSDFISNSELGVTLVLDVDIVLRFASDWRGFRHRRRNWVDLGLAIVTTVIQIPAIHNSGVPYAWLTVFQILRIYRIVLAVRMTRDLITLVLRHASGVLNLILFVFLLTFLAAIFAVQLFRGEIPEQDEEGNTQYVNFSTIFNSFLGMYQILSSENWTTIMYNVTRFEAIHGTAWIGATFFIIWFILAFFIVLNMFIAVIQENFDVSEDQKRLQQVRMFLQQKELSSSSHGTLSLSKIFKFGYAKRQDPLDFGSAATEMLLKDAVVRDFLDDQLDTEGEAGGPTPGISRGATNFIRESSGWLENSRDWIVKKLFDREPNPFHARLKLTKAYDELDPRTLAREVVNATEQRKVTQREYLRRHPTYNKSLYLFSVDNPVRRLCQRIVGPGRGDRIEGVQPYPRIWYTFSAFVYAAIVAMVILACVTTPLYQKEYFDHRQAFSRYNWFLYTDMAFATLFAVETIIKVIADGFFWTPNAYFRSSWGFIDGVVLVTLWVNVLTSLYDPGGGSRAVGAFKALRALRLLNVSDSARDTFHSVIVLGGWKVVSAAFVSLSLLIPFAIYGLNLFAGQMQGCNDGNSNIYNLTDCIGEYMASPYNWEFPAPRQVSNQWYDFDSFGGSLFILFQIVSQEGWVDVMNAANSITGVFTQPNPFASQGNSVFFVVFNLLGAVFVLTLFVSVFMRNYTEQTGVAFLTTEQRSWLELRKLLRQVAPSKRPNNKKKREGWQEWCYRRAVTKNGRWQRTVTTILVLHLILLCLEFYPEAEWWTRTRDYTCLLYTSPSPRDRTRSRMPSSA